MAEIMLKGRRVPLLYTVLEMKTVQEEIGPLGDLQYTLFGRDRDDPESTAKYAGPEHLDAVAKMIRILGNAGLEESGEKPDLTDRKVLRAMRPTDLAEAVNACVAAMNEGMASEVIEADDQDQGPVDVVLEEMKKKEATGG
jgi:hypothetical protein